MVSFVNPIMMKVYQAERVACLVEACQPSEALVVLLQVGCIVGIICEPNYDEGVSGSRHTSSLTSARRSTGPQPDSASRHQHTTLLPITCSHNDVSDSCSADSMMSMRCTILLMVHCKMHSTNKIKCYDMRNVARIDQVDAMSKAKHVFNVGSNSTRSFCSAVAHPL